MRLKIVNLSLLLISISFIGQSCSFWGNCIEGKGAIIEKEITLEEFSKISLSSSAKVYLKQGDIRQVTIKAQSNLIDLLKTEVSGDEWKVEFEKCIKSSKGVEIFIVTPIIEELEINGSGTIISEGIINANKVELSIKGSGEMNLELDVKELECEIAGSGDIKLKGKTKLQDIEVNGSGDIDAYDLLSDETSIDINGSGDVKVNVSYSLKVDINGSGDVYYKGDVKEISSDINGSGNLNQAR